METYKKTEPKAVYKAGRAQRYWRQATHEGTGQLETGPQRPGRKVGR